MFNTFSDKKKNPKNKTPKQFLLLYKKTSLFYGMEDWTIGHSI